MKRIYLLTASIILLFCTQIFATKWELLDDYNIKVENQKGYETTILFKKMVKLNDVFFASARVNLDGVVKSYDKGKTWDSCFYTPSSTVEVNQAIYGLIKQGNSLFSPGTEGRIYNSFDGGETWSFTYLGDKDKHPIKHLKFINDSIGFVGHILGSVFSKTTDGGHTWNPLPDATDQLPSIFGMLNFVPVDENTIYFVGAWQGTYYFYYTDDGGETWNKLDTEPFESFEQTPAMYYHLNYREPYFWVEKLYKPTALGNTSIMQSTDFVNWEPIFISDTISGGKYLHDIKYFDDKILGLGLDIFIISTDDGETWVDLYDEDDEFYSRNNPINGFVYDDGYVYAQGTIKEMGDDSLMYAIPKLFRYNLSATSVDSDYNVKISLYPNPASLSLNIQSERSISLLKIIDLSGNILFTRTYRGSQNEVNIETSELTNGTYFININDRIYKRFVKE